MADNGWGKAISAAFGAALALVSTSIIECHKETVDLKKFKAEKLLELHQKCIDESEWINEARDSIKRSVQGFVLPPPAKAMPHIIESWADLYTIDGLEKVRNFALCAWNFEAAVSAARRTSGFGTTVNYWVIEKHGDKFDTGKAITVTISELVQIINDRYYSAHRAIQWEVHELLGLTHTPDEEDEKKREALPFIACYLSK